MGCARRSEMCDKDHNLRFRGLCGCWFGSDERRACYRAHNSMMRDMAVSPG